MALVAYDGSGSSSSEDEDEPMVPIHTGVGTKGNDNPKTGTSSSMATAVSRSGATTSVTFSKFIDDEEDEMEDLGKQGKGNSILSDSTEGANPTWSKFLPQPKKVPSGETTELEDDVEIGPIPPKKIYGDEEQPPPKPSTIPSLNATKVKGKVRISIPFLNSLEEEEPEEANKKKYMEPSKKGSGLFALLPQPKNTFGDSKATISSFLKSTTTSTKPTVDVNLDKGESSSAAASSSQPGSSRSFNKLVPDAVKNRLKRPAQSKLDEIRAKFSKRGQIQSSKSNTVQNDSDDSGDDEGDFFSLDRTETMDEAALEMLKLPTPNFDKKEETQEESMEVEEEEDDNYQQQSTSEDLMRFIQPKKGRKQDIQIIDINADDLRPDNTEFLKNMTDQSAVPARKAKGLGGMVKRKHQITYLAFEAKAREEELKNQWAQNRANKTAARNKYGF